MALSLLSFYYFFHCFVSLLKEIAKDHWSYGLLNTIPPFDPNKAKDVWYFPDFRLSLSVQNLNFSRILWRWMNGLTNFLPYFNYKFMRVNKADIIAIASQLWTITKNNCGRGCTMTSSTEMKWFVSAIIEYKQEEMSFLADSFHFYIREFGQKRGQ
jgi:hypothetical protein